MSSDNEFHLGCRNLGDWIDLTCKLNGDTWIYSGDGYSDPSYASKPWATVSENRFEVWQLSLGTQTGTHIDAPSHFVSGGETMDDMRPGDIAGTYTYVDAQWLQDPGFRLNGDTASHLFLDARSQHLADTGVVTELLRSAPRVWVMAGEFRVRHDDPLWFHLKLAESGKFLAEDLCTEHVGAIPTNGDVVTAPLSLEGLSGSPARVMIRG